MLLCFDSLVLTYTCVPVGSGIRIALDRDEDGIWNGDEWKREGRKN